MSGTVLPPPPLFNLAHLPLSSLCRSLCFSPLTPHLSFPHSHGGNLGRASNQTYACGTVVRRILQRRIALEREEAKINDKSVIKHHCDPNRRRNRQFGLEWLADVNVESGCGMSNRDCKKCFRMDRECFSILHDIVYPFLSRIHTSAMQATRGSGSQVTVKTKLVRKTPTFHFFALFSQHSTSFCFYIRR